MDSRTLHQIRLIVGGLGTILDVEFDRIVWDRSTRLKILLDVTKLLHRIQNIHSKDGNIVMIEVKYERLPNFCYVCGKLGHIKRECQSISEDVSDEEKQWGSCLKASPRRS